MYQQAKTVTASTASANPIFQPRSEATAPPQHANCQRTDQSQRQQHQPRGPLSSSAASPRPRPAARRQSTDLHHGSTDFGHLPTVTTEVVVQVEHLKAKSAGDSGHLGCANFGIGGIIWRVVHFMPLYCRCNQFMGGDRRPSIAIHRQKGQHAHHSQYGNPKEGRNRKLWLARHVEQRQFRSWTRSAQQRPRQLPREGEAGIRRMQAGRAGRVGP